ncbi:acyltransferase family protein [Mycolicibacterium sphagni]|uniref:Acyltransferase n=1 Tax=Mycolicibacterium sphagni TaxID=1786 RepID=A0A255DDL0_9MYCO|nr:acyltransferase [Mycolicibacterium sphagni]OYN75032.1 acyltransferase [Mycolicibacterium sphagni]
MTAEPKSAADSAPVVPRGGSLESAFDPRRNALNACRLVMATGVIVYHSWLLTGRHLSFAPAHQLLRDVWVDGFFTISGFLITWSWFRHPRVRQYFVARGLRILPGLWFCLIVTAFVIAPIGVAIQGGSAGKLLLSPAPFEYVVGNSAVMLTQQGVGATPSGIPVPGVWNGSLWTLIWEVLCYIAVAVFGAVGLLRRRWFIPTLFALTLLWSIRLPAWSVFADLAESQQKMDAATATLFVQAIVARFALMFLAGALIYQFRNVIPARWSLVVLSVAIVLVSSFLPNYRVLAALPLAYAVIVTGALIHNRRFRLRTDLSYGVYVYAWPIQQLLVICGLAVLSPVVFAIVATAVTVPLAAVSWFVVEKPAIALKSRFERRKATAQESGAGSTPPAAPAPTAAPRTTETPR